MTEMYFSLLRTGISEESIWKLRSLPYAIWFLWNLSRIFNGMPHCSTIPLIRARENGSAMACVNLWLKTLRLSLSCRHPHPILHPSLSRHSSFTSCPFSTTFCLHLFFSPPPPPLTSFLSIPVFFLYIAPACMRFSFLPSNRTVIDCLCLWTSAFKYIFILSEAFPLLVVLFNKTR